ncbi:MAG: SMI1/KNR4 family protein [Silicimonas sp.]|nr:SMI1/KNR4 family protein [Silicimonas sp.]
MRAGLQAYFAQFRALSETYWSSHVERGLEEFRDRGIGGATWASGTRWKPGLPQVEIDRIEAEFGAKFPGEYRAFLATLNAPDRPAHWYLYQGSVIEPAPDGNIFCDWTEDFADARRAERKLISGILFDVEHGAIWQDEWGIRPRDHSELAAHITSLVENAPKLVPLHSHRFLVAGLDLEPAPVLSIMQSDVIYYAESIEHCLAADFPDLAPGLEPPEVTVDEAACLEALRAVPFWGGLLS